jgi:ribonuclease BN (tRNA processing enzyme)
MNRQIAVLVVVLLLSCPRVGIGAAVAPGLDLVVLGSGGPGAAGRAASSYLVSIDGLPRILVDAGPGSFVRLGEAGLSLADTDIVLLTHLHIDHVGEIPGLFKARAVSASGPTVFNVWGPGGSPGGREDAFFPGTRELMRTLFGPKGAYAYLRDFASPMTIRAHDIAAPLENAAPQKILDRDGMSITAVAGHHGDAPAVIYRIEHGGKSIVFSGDIDARGIAALRMLAKDADLLVFNSVVLDPPGSPEVLYGLHTPPHVIGEVATKAGVHALLLSHISPAVDGNHDAVLNSIRAGYAGPVSFAKDGMRTHP